MYYSSQILNRITQWNSDSIFSRATSTLLCNRQHYYCESLSQHFESFEFRVCELLKKIFSFGSFSRCTAHNSYSPISTSCLRHASAPPSARLYSDCNVKCYFTSKSCVQSVISKSCAQSAIKFLQGHPVPVQGHPVPVFEKA